MFLGGWALGLEHLDCTKERRNESSDNYSKENCSWGRVGVSLEYRLSGVSALTLFLFSSGSQREKYLRIHSIVAKGAEPADGVSNKETRIEKGRKSSANWADNKDNAIYLPFR